MGFVLNLNLLKTRRIIMAITLSEVEHIAKLAKLEFSPEEKEKFTRQLAKILEYVEKLNELDTEQVEPTSHVIPIRNVFREDTVRESLPREEALRNAPRSKLGFFSVPKVISES